MALAAVSKTGDIGFSGCLFASLGIAERVAIFAEAGYRRMPSQALVVPPTSTGTRNSRRYQPERQDLRSGFEFVNGLHLSLEGI